MAREKDYERLLERFPYEYYSMDDPIERKKLLDLATERGIDPEGNVVRYLLWNRRHPDAQKQIAKNQIVTDMFIKSWMALDILSEDTKSRWKKNRITKNVKKQLEVLGLDLVLPYGMQGVQVYYEEMYQLIRYYIQLCQEDKIYGSAVLGLFKLPKDEYANKVAQNLYRVCHKIPKDLEMQEDFAILQKAALEAFYDMFPGHQDIYDKVLEKGM